MVLMLKLMLMLMPMHLLSDVNKLGLFRLFRIVPSRWNRANPYAVRLPSGLLHNVPLFH
jgi:hypothetical protein